MTGPTVGDLLDSPQGARLLAEMAREAHESDLRMLKLYQETSARGGPPVPKALWRRIVRYRREHP